MYTQPSSYSDKSKPTQPQTTKLVLSTETKEIPLNAHGKSFWDNDTAFLPGNNLLVSSSLGLYHWRGKFYMQIITSHNEHNYIVEIPAALAVTISEQDYLEITNVKDENTTTIGSHFS